MNRQMNPVLQTVALRAGYDRKIVVQDVQLKVDAGEVLVLIGPNGAGKSTVLKTIAGQLERIEGDIYLHGTETRQMERNEMARNMSVVLTERLHPEMMTCRDMVATGRYPYTGRMGILTEKDWDVVNRAIEAVHAEEIAEQDFMKISDGQRQRVMLARALCQEPDVLILDEPTSFLDLRYKADILSTLRRSAKKRGIAVILSLHELEFAAAVADRVACIGAQRIQRIGTPEEIITPETLESVFRMPEGSGIALVRGLKAYSAELEKLVRR